MTDTSSLHIDTDSLTWRVTPDLLGVVTEDGRFHHTNPAWLVTLGRQPEDIESKPFIAFVHPDDVEPTNNAFERIKRGEPVLQFENRYRHKDGSYRWLSWNAVPEGAIFFCNARDITAAKEIEQSLNSKNREVRLREQFMSMLGHDLRNPLAAIISGLRIMSRRHKDPASTHVVEQAQQAAQRMATLIDDMQDFTRFSLGSDKAKMQIQEDAQLRPALTQAIEAIQRANSFATIETTLDFTDPVRCDPVRLAQLVNNLLDNAINHGEANLPIAVHAYDIDDVLVITVSNGGRAIPEETRVRLFEPFNRATDRRAQNGLGLGLYIARQIALGHQGTLTMTSDDEATVFTLRVPRA